MRLARERLQTVYGLHRGILSRGVQSYNTGVFLFLLGLSSLLCGIRFRYL